MARQSSGVRCSVRCQTYTPSSRPEESVQRAEPRAQTGRVDQAMLADPTSHSGGSVLVKHQPEHQKQRALESPARDLRQRAGRTARLVQGKRRKDTNNEEGEELHEHCPSFGCGANCASRPLGVTIDGTVFQKNTGVRKMPKSVTPSMPREHRDAQRAAASRRRRPARASAAPRRG